MDNNDKKSDSSAKNSDSVDDVEFSRGEHPNSLKAISKHQFQKGISGNVFGRKPNYTKLGEALSKLGDEETFDYGDKSQGTRREQLLKKIWSDAIRYGDWKKIQLLAWLGCLDD
tara:strand:- start:6 stop:347 length:342 start_codon:yes stop_codon:yes gene_type:complete